VHPRRRGSGDPTPSSAPPNIPTELLSFIGLGFGCSKARWNDGEVERSRQ
jgi:hypothetical protein